MLLGLHYTDANVAGIITSALPATIAFDVLDYSQGAHFKEKRALHPFCHAWAFGHCLGQMA